MNKLLITIICCFFNLLLGYGQTSVTGPNSNKPFESIRRIQNRHGEYSKIEFWDSTSNTLIKTLDLVQSSPYTHLPEIQVRSMESDLPIYKIPVKTNQRKVKAFYVPDNIPRMTDTLFVTSINKLSNIDNPELICIVYQIMTSSGGIYRNILSTHSTLVVYNKRGEELRSIENIKADPYDIQITASGDYIFFQTGEEYAEGQSDIPKGFHIMDLRTQKYIFSKYGVYKGASILYEKLFRITKELKEQVIEYQIINPVTQTRYVKKFDLRKNGYPRAFDTEKCNITDPLTQKVSFLYYERDFEKDQL